LRELAFEGGLVEDAPDDGIVVFELDVLGVGTGDLEGPKEERGFAIVDGAVEKTPDYLHEGDLDGVGVLEDGKLRGGAATGFGAGEQTGASVVVVEVAEFALAEGGRAAAVSVGLDVGAKFHGFLLIQEGTPPGSESFFSLGCG
jgi:hypothetical protein